MGSGIELAGGVRVLPSGEPAEGLSSIKSPGGSGGAIWSTDSFSSVVLVVTGSFIIIAMLEIATRKSLFVLVCGPEMARSAA